tara:strand:+ start:1693 stop:2184 length:492 start_codon:yes stop_codon:yes gene_type:complete
MSEENSDPSINSLVDQLKDATLVNNHIQKDEAVQELQKEDIEDFVIKNSSELINQSLDVMNNVKDYIMASGDPDSISALSELIRASSGAIESLNKIVIQNKRSATSIATKQMDISSRHAIEDKKNENALIAGREEIFKKILDQAKVIDVDDSTNSDPDNSKQD